MNANEDFSYAQQLHRSLMAKSEWTSLLIDVQRSTDEKLLRRSRMHRQANDFLHDLLHQRPEPSSIDDYAALDHYHRQSQVTPDMFVHNEQTSITIDALETIEIGKDEKAIVQRVHIEQERVKTVKSQVRLTLIDSSVQINIPIAADNDMRYQKLFYTDADPSRMSDRGIDTAESVQTTGSTSGWH